MKREIKILTSLFVAQALCMVSAANAQTKATNAPEEVVLFKIHDIVPERDADGKVLYCNIGATFFNRTKSDLANVSLNLAWEDEVISEAIEQEERATREMRRTNPQANVSRYPTSALNERMVTMSLKLPPIKVNQQVSLKAKVSTERCFILLNEMDITVTNCGTAEEVAKNSHSNCNNLFRYISPKMPEYYQEFKEKSLEEETAVEDEELNSTKKELEESYKETIQSIRNITNDDTTVSSKDEESAE